VSRIENFGGKWTEQKLEVLEKYLRAYVKIFDRNPHARFFETIYVDAFAGAGYIEQATPNETELELLPGFNEEAAAFIEGSARRALDLQPGFSKYLFIEQDEARCGRLHALREDYKHKRVRVENAEANQFLRHWCASTDWNRSRAVVFLDPFGMQVAWDTVEAVARTNAIDLWYLFPVGAVMRLLTHAQPPSSWAGRLTAVLGTTDWKSEFYLREEKDTLFGKEQGTERNVDTERVGRFFVKRLNAIFAKVASRPILLRNSKNVPLYLFCFAAGNPVGSSTAVKIANDLIRKISEGKPR
jgi:three-Cys-motif partner protein